jgi:glycerol-3-phosphate acyltransferase PlsY
VIDFLLATLSYLFGSIPFAYILARLYGKDIANYGDRNIGATNAYYATGRLWVWIAAALLDALKSFLPAYFWGPWYGVIAVFGHIFSVFVWILLRRFVAGAGTASSIGFALAVNPWLIPLAFGIFAVYYLVMRPGGKLMDFFAAERGYTPGMVMLWATYTIAVQYGMITGEAVEAMFALVVFVSLTYAYKLRYLYQKWGILNQK